MKTLSQTHSMNDRLSQNDIDNILHASGVLISNIRSYVLRKKKLREEQLSRREEGKDTQST